MRSYLDRWTRQLVRRGVRSGLIEGSNTWLSIGAVAWLVRFLSRRPPLQVSVERLRLGESLIVTHVPAPPRSRRQRRKAARTAAKLEARQAEQQAKREASRRYARARVKAADALAAEAAKRERKAARAASSRRSRRSDEDGGAALPGKDGEEPA